MTQWQYHYFTAPNTEDLVEAMQKYMNSTAVLKKLNPIYIKVGIAKAHENVPRGVIFYYPDTSKDVILKVTTKPNKWTIRSFRSGSYTEFHEKLLPKAQSYLNNIDHSESVFAKMALKDQIKGDIRLQFWSPQGR